MGQTYPRPILKADVVPANQNFDKPRYYNAADWSPGVTGDDTSVSKATYKLADADGSANEADYTPRVHTDIPAKANWTAGTARVLDVTRPRGSVGPQDRYPVAADAAPAAPTISSLSPNTAVHGAQPLVVTITGTNFTPWSTVSSGGTGSPWDSSAKYLSPTQMTVVLDPRGAIAGTISIAVIDHSVASTPAGTFTFT